MMANAIISALQIPTHASLSEGVGQDNMMPLAQQLSKYKTASGHQGTNQSALSLCLCVSPCPLFISVNVYSII